MIDLATAKEWYGLRPGMSRAEAVRVIEAAGAEFSEDANDPGWMLVSADKWGLELRFAEDGEQRLRQVAIDSEECVWNGKPFIGAPVHQAIEAMGDEARQTGWRPEDGVNEAFDDLQPLGAGPFSDETLLEAGTLWVPRRALGLSLIEGSICDVVWRDARDVPKEFVGPLTEAQRQISRRPDVVEYLRSQTTAVAPKPMNWAQRGLTLLFVAALAYLGREAWMETQRWHAAPVLSAKVISIEKATAKPWIDRFQVRYQDPSGRSREAVVPRSEFYVAPEEIGAETQIAFLDGDPPQVKGPAHSRDAGFLKYMPQAIAVVAVWGAGMLLAGRIRPREEPPADRSTLPVPPGLN
jgi:hypothetical protein